MGNEFIVEKKDFIDVFSKYYKEQNCSEPEQQILYEIGQFFDNCFGSFSDARSTDEFINTSKALGTDMSVSLEPFTRAIAWIAMKYCESISNNGSDADTHHKLLAFLDMMRLSVDFDTDVPSSEIRDMFSFIQNDESQTKLLNSYKGLRVFHSADFIEIGNDDRVVMKIHPEQAKALEYEGYTCITHKLLPQQVSAQVSKVDTVHNTVELTNLVVLKKPFDRRKIYRLQPESPIHGVLFVEGNKMHVEIVDVSLRGLSLNLTENLVSANSEIRISFSLPVSGGDEVVLRGKLKYIFCEKTCKMGLETFPDHSQESLIRRYLVERMKGIENELSQEG
jgi:hypothetical protein